jgi:O-antigen/teichoic acid export membrane protein
MPGRAKSTFGSLISRLGSESLLRNGIYIMGTTAAPMGLGFVFWVLAARILPAAEVGRAAALVSAMLFVSVFTNLGLGQVLVSRLASRSPGREWSLTVTTALAATAVVSLIGGALAAVLLPLLIPALRGGIGLGTFVLLPIGVAAAACSLVIDHACIAERHTRPAFLRNAFAAAFRLALIGVAGVVPVAGATWILAIWVSSFVLIDVGAFVRVLPALGHDYHPTLHGWRQELRDIRHLVAGHQAINIGVQASSYLLPVIVAARLGTTENAYFYTTFMVASGLFFIAPSIANSFFAEGIHNPKNVNRELRKAVRHISMLAIPIGLLLVAAGPLVLLAFGAAYAENGSSLLRILVLAAVFDAALQLVIALLRIHHLLRSAAIATFVGLAFGIGAAWTLLAPLGLDGAGVGWMIGKIAGLCTALALLARHMDAGELKGSRNGSEVADRIAELP